MPQLDAQAFLAIVGFIALAAALSAACVFARRRLWERWTLNELRLEGLLRISQYRATSIQELLDFALDEAIALTRSKIGFVFHYDEEAELFTLNSWSKEAMKQCRTSEQPTTYRLETTGLWGQPVRQQRPLVVNRYNAPNPHKKGYPEGHVHIARLLIIPVFIENKIVAVVGVANKKRPYDSSDVRQLTLLMDATWSIVDRRRTEDELRRSAERLRLHVQQSALAVIEWDANLRIISWNPAAERIFGYRAAEAIGSSDTILVPPEARATVDLVWKRVSIDHLDTDSTNLNRTKDGRNILCRWCNTPLTDSTGQFIGVATIAEDVTEIRRMQDELRTAKEAAEAATRAKSQFLATMSHEIRTPLTAILGFTDLLADPAISPDTRTHYLSTIHQSGEHLTLLINDILDLSKIDAGRLVLNLEPCSPLEAISGVADIMRFSAAQRHDTIAIECATDMPEIIYADNARLRQALMNLVGNAVKFTENGSIRLRASWLPKWKGSEPAIRIEVIDTGIGIATEVLPRLFQPFIQADSTNSRKFGGSGLGLAITHHIVEFSGGELTVESKPGQGSTFAMTIPTGDLRGVRMIPANSSPPNPTTASKPTTSPAATNSNDLHDVRVLLAEDGYDNQRLISTILRKAGAAVDVAENGRIAVDKAESGNFDVILMDMSMPEMDGYEATRVLRNRNYHKPIVALTAHAMVDDKARCLGAGCDEYMSKPIDRQCLILMVGRYARLANNAPPSASSPAQSAPQDKTESIPMTSQ